MFAKPSDYAGASYFKPGDHQTALALLVEPKTIERGVPNTYAGQTKPRDEVIADISVFENQSALDSKTPTTVLKSTKVVHGMLTSTLEKILGGAMVATVTKIATKNGSGFVFRDVTSDIEAKVGEFYQGREAAVEEALASAPSFD